MLVLLLSCVTASIAFTVSETVLFRTFRENVTRWSPWLGKLFSCGYCLGHWVAFGLVAGYRPRVFWSQVAVLDYGFTALLVAWAGAFQWVVLVILFKVAGK
ncbi:MAG: DUF1360 domain-containing protein [Planctomycetes bacterium]|nr:DUF1360 domain-containing protein [Planctomycetota bacterium]